MGHAVYGILIFVVDMLHARASHGVAQAAIYSLGVDMVMF
jgi:hypothetical protein